MSSHANYRFALARRRGIVPLHESSARATFGVMRAKTQALAVFVILLISGRVALADEGLATFRHIAEPVTPAKAEVDNWPPVPTEKPSIANLAPGLLPYFNNAPVFGLPGTVTGDLENRTQLTGDWGGARTDLARRGYFFDMYSTSTFQDVKSGGIKTGSAFVQNTQLSLNLDTERAGFWPGGLFHFTVQSRYGSLPDKTFTVGSYVPQYTGFVEPGPLFANNTFPSEYYLAQAFSKTFSAVIGKISDVFIPDQTLFGNSYKYYFANFNLNKNPMTTNFYNPTAWAALGVWTPSESLAIGGGVLDPNSKSDNFATNAFDKVNLYLTAIASYKVAGLPGQFSPAFNWSNKPKIDLGSPFAPLAPTQVPQAVGVLFGLAPTEGLQVNYKQNSEFLIANFSQYLYVQDDAAEIAAKLKSGQPLRGVGVFGRFGFAPENANPVTRDASVALFGHGLFDSRPYDSFGVGYYYNKISGDLKNTIGQLTAGTASVGNERGMEIFYDFAITPAIRLIASYQHTWDPLIAQVATKQNSASVVLTRLNVAF